MEEGWVDVAEPEPRVEPTPRWVRVRAGDVWVADSRRALLLAWYGPGMLPTYCFPTDDVRIDLIRPSSSPGTAPMTVLHDLVIGDQVLEGAATLFHDPPGPTRGPGRALDVHLGRAGFVVRGGAGDPCPRPRPIQAGRRVPSERRVRVEIAGQRIAESTRPHALFETTLPTRWYLPVDDVDWELLEPSDTATRCPYKGTATYWSVRAGGELHRDVVWSYPEPVPECPCIAGLVCFFNEKVDLVIDGVPQPRPRTPWS